MSNEITTPAPKRDALSQMFSGLIELAKDPNVEPEKMAQIVNLQRTMIHDMREQEFAKAMSAARLEMPRITKEGKITNKQGSVQSRFAHFEAIDQIIRPIAASHGLSYGFNVSEGEGGKLLVSCLVTHLSDHGALEKTFGPMPLSIDTTGAKNATQGAGSAASYGKRYCLIAAFNIITENEDDDGNMGRAQHATPSAHFDAMLEEARTAATKGSDAYAKWFKGRSNMERGWLVDEGHHQDLKAAAENYD